MLADEAGQQLLEGIGLAAGNQRVGDFPGQFGGNVIEGGQKGVAPALRTVLLERLQGAPMFGGGHLLQDGADPGHLLLPD